MIWIFPSPSACCKSCFGLTSNQHIVHVLNSTITDMNSNQPPVAKYITSSAAEPGNRSETLSSPSNGSKWGMCCAGIFSFSHVDVNLFPLISLYQVWTFSPYSLSTGNFNTHRHTSALWKQEEGTTYTWRGVKSLALWFVSSTENWRISYLKKSFKSSYNLQNRLSH